MGKGGGKKPAGEMMALKPERKKKKIPAPKGMAPEATKLWRQIVDSYPEDYFRTGDLPLLRSYCEEYARTLEAKQHLLDEGTVYEMENGRMFINPWHGVLVQSTNALCSIATKLRICANSRVSKDGAAADGVGDISGKTASARSGLMFGSGVTQ